MGSSIAHSRENGTKKYIIYFFISDYIVQARLTHLFSGQYCYKYQDRFFYLMIIFYHFGKNKNLLIVYYKVPKMFLLALYIFEIFFLVRITS